MQFKGNHAVHSKATVQFKSNRAVQRQLCSSKATVQFKGNHAALSKATVLFKGSSKATVQFKGNSVKGGLTMNSGGMGFGHRQFNDKTKLL